MNAEKREKVEKEREEAEERAKKPYTTPRLTKFGDVEEFTGSVGYDNNFD